MQPSKEQIENAARLDKRVFKSEHSKLQDGLALFGEGDKLRYWQPWADTEAGSADWAVLDAAVRVWVYSQTNAGNAIPPGIWEYYNALCRADASGDLKQRKAAAFATAVAIGEHIGGSDE